MEPDQQENLATKVNGEKHIKGIPNTIKYDLKKL